MTFRFIFIALFAISLVSAAPSPGLSHDNDSKRPLDHDAYDRWNTIRSTSISQDGKWVLYSVVNGKDESTLQVRSTQSKIEFSIPRGSGAQFSFDSRFFACIVPPDPKVVKELKKKKTPADQMPVSKLELIRLSDGHKTSVDNVSSFSFPEKAGGWLAFRINDASQSEKLKLTPSGVSETYQVTPGGLQLPKPKTEVKPESAASKKAAVKKSPKPTAKKPDPPKASKESKKKSLGTSLVVRNLDSGREHRFPNVMRFQFSLKAKALALTTSGEKPEDDGVTVIQLNTMRSVQVINGRGEYGAPVFDEAENQLAFLSNRDDYEHKDPAWNLYHCSTIQARAKLLVNQETKGMPAAWWVAQTVTPKFTIDGNRLILATRPIPEDRDKKAEDSEATDEEEKAELDIWHWEDPVLQPEQKLRAEQERRRSYTALWDLRRKRFIQLANKEMPVVVIDVKNPSSVVVGVSDESYKKMRSWDLPGYADIFLVDLNSGRSRKILEKSRGVPTLSPHGKFISWWDGDRQKWFAMSTRTPAKNESIPKVDLGRGIPFPLQNELHDSPSVPSSYGSGGWTDNDESILLYDRWDIWQVDPTGKKAPVNATLGQGREAQRRYLLVRLDSEQRTWNPQSNWILSMLDHKTKDSGYAVKSAGDKPEIRTLISLPENVSGLAKAKQADQVILTRSTFQRCPDLWCSTLSFKKIHRLSRVNPQQHEYLWGDVELVHWKATDGQNLDGLLYKPENFDATKKYPMIVYFYERYSDRKHSYYAPAAGRSIINFSFYVSRGYLIFIPDIPYKTGAPGPSAVNSIMPGVDSLIKQGFVNEKKIGLQGHSWGGYQSAYLVTQTNRFACAESGAPVSNMTSAYGGIRWGSGMSRMFQYEKTQSRIGATLWEAPEKYIANSPLFFADKIETPLLILHNDKDTAVPWYQGIELFVAMRRLGKPAWMLNYNNDPHWVMGQANRRDFAKRMQQFFDHYLKDEPMPVWMDKGLPAVDKGKKFGFEPSKN